MASTSARSGRKPSGGARRSWQLALPAAITLGLIGGVLAVRKPGTALLLCVCLAALVGLAMLGERAFSWAVVIVAVVPWYPFLTEGSEAPIVAQKVLCSAVAAAALAPWLWSLARGERNRRPSRGALLMAVLFLGLAILIHENVNGIEGMINSKIIGYLFAGVVFLCARRFGDERSWPAAACGGLLALTAMGALAYVQNPSGRVGYFSGYPITYGALVVGLLPGALLYASSRSRLLAAALATATAALLILSQSRSSWVAVAVMLIAIALLQARAGNFRALAALGSIVAVLAAVILGTGSLHHIVEARLSDKIATTQSVTHRQWSYGYAVHEVGLRPIFGAGEIGYSARESANKTTIGAIDNGYLSIAVDLGLVGLIAVAIPIAIALLAIGRCLRFAVCPGPEVALALGILGIAVVTIFYDSFYWAQIDLLLGAMGGLLSTRLSQIARGTRSQRPARAARPQAGDLTPPRWRGRPLGWL